MILVTLAYMKGWTCGSTVTKTKFSRTDRLPYFHTNGDPHMHVELHYYTTKLLKHFYEKICTTQNNTTVFVKKAHLHCYYVLFHQHQQPLNTQHVICSTTESITTVTLHVHTQCDQKIIKIIIIPFWSTWYDDIRC